MHRKPGRIAAIILLLLGAAVAANAQTPIVNPSSVTWDHTDYVTASAYTGGYFALPVKPDHTCDIAAAPAAQPTQTDNLGKPTTTTGVAMTAALVAKPIGCYVMKVQAVDVSGLVSPWSLPSGPFTRPPAAPGVPAVK